MVEFSPDDFGVLVGVHVTLELKGGAKPVSGWVVGPYEHPMNDMPATLIDRRDDSDFPTVAVMHHTIERAEITEERHA